MEVFENEQEELRVAEEKIGIKRPAGSGGLGSCFGEGFAAEKRARNEDLIGSDGEAETAARTGRGTDTAAEDEAEKALAAEESAEEALMGDDEDEE